MTFPEKFYKAKAAGGEAFEDACHEARALGYLVSDGHITETGSVAGSVPAPSPTDPEIVNKFSGDAKGVKKPEAK